MTRVLVAEEKKALVVSGAEQQEGQLLQVADRAKLIHHKVYREIARIFADQVAAGGASIAYRERETCA